MATHSTTIKMTAKPLVKKDDKKLDEIVSGVDNYLFNFGQNRIFLTMGRSYFQRCCRSWSKVTIHLDKFLQDPRANYSMLMITLEHEIKKFPQQSFYAKQLKSLARLVSKGPNFSITQITH
ncbi:MAG: hypothetical protein JSS07_10175 [Proteobacteria bacterium]|nr:hypothetical protein [Pseudomonadota bacterium]